MADEYIKRKAAYNAIVKNYDTDAQLRDLDAIPAADVVPVVRGRWIEEFDGFIRSYTCSECGEYALTKEETMHDEVCSNFCPSCGAKMDADMREVQDE